MIVITNGDFSTKMLFTLLFSTVTKTFEICKIISNNDNIVLSKQLKMCCMNICYQYRSVNLWLLGNYCSIPA